jgi:iron complex transport system substrate-binding protein
MLLEALAVYEVDEQRLREVKPDVVVTQDLCNVCAVSLDDVRAALRTLARADVAIVSLHPRRLHDVWEDVRRIAAAIGRARFGDVVSARLQQRCRELGARVPTGPRPTVLTIEWLDPVMIGGTWMPELIELAGGTALLVEPGADAPTVSLDQLAAVDPDAVLIKPCGFTLPRVEEELGLLADRLPWQTWSAVKKGRVFVTDGSAYFNRPGPRLVDSIEILAACVHPAAFANLVARHTDAVRVVTPVLSLARVPGGSAA